MRVRRDDKRIQIKAVATVLMNFGAHMNRLVIIMRIIMFIKWSYRSLNYVGD